MTTSLDPQVIAGLLAVLAALIGAAGHMGAAYVQRPREPRNPGRRLLGALADRLGRERRPTVADRIGGVLQLATPIALALLGAALLLWR